jgi:hypothetical protein
MASSCKQFTQHAQWQAVCNCIFNVQQNLDLFLLGFQKNYGCGKKRDAWANIMCTICSGTSETEQFFEKPIRTNHIYITERNKQMVWIFKLNFIKGILKTSTYIQHS